MRTLRGKYLVRKSKLHNGEPVIIITGVFRPLDFDHKDLHDNDEMWVSDIQIQDGGVKFTEPFNYVGSTEDFLGGNFQRPEDWKNKTILK